MDEQDSPLPENRCSGVSEAATALLREVRRRAAGNANGRCWINRAAIYDATGAAPGDASVLLQELIDHKDVILEGNRDNGWLLFVPGEAGPA